MEYALFAMLVALVIFGPSIIKWKAARDHAADLRRYAEITEPIFERSRDEDDTGVFARCERHRAMLIESGNKWKPPVYGIIFQEAGFYGETWEEFEGRAVELEKREMNDWLLESKRRDLLTYYRTSMRQRAAMN